ncbi:Cytochrome P450 86B1 [Morella rubra]|uniref:Cytochrome P450 86B1 n=1 Tax=Morella rubra TaxID=262757 RepID=A0A6A1UV22_9ROSI|nr:Cytochrome P450 86B1 [Morella rubra]
MLLGVLCFVFLGHWKRNKNSPITNWPVVGMVLALLSNASDMYESANRFLKHYGGTVDVKGPPGLLAWTLSSPVILKFELFLEKVVRQKVLNGLILVLDHISNLQSQREELSRSRTQMEEADFSLLAAYMMLEDKGGGTLGTEKFLRDTVFNLMAAGSDTMGMALSRSLWLEATHPSVEAKILDEMKEKVMVKDDMSECFGTRELHRLVYLHAALCEALRLYPVVAFDPRTAVGPDTLPSGRHVGPNTKIIIFLYAMGRMEEIWGEDCLEYRPERWISEQGGIISVPSYKFSSFGGGPRSCLGKAMAFIQM